MSAITVAKLHKMLGDLVESGHGRKPVCINKESFRHNCEGDGVVILEVESVDGPIWIGNASDDGGTKFNKDGTESGCQTVVLKGGA